MSAAIGNDLCNCEGNSLLIYWFLTVKAAIKYHRSQQVMSDTAILTTRQLSNENTGLDIFVTGDLRGDSVFENDKVEYTIVVVSNLESLQKSKLQRNSTFQFSVRKTHSACLKLQKEIINLFPEFDVPDIPGVSSKENSTDACYRQKKLTKFFDFCSRSSKIANSSVLLSFLGIIAEKEMEEERGKHHSKDRNRRRKSSNKKDDLFDDGHSPVFQDVVFEEEEEEPHSSPFDFFHRSRKKKNSESDKSSSRHTFSWFKSLDLEEKSGNNNHKKGVKVEVTKTTTYSSETIEDDDDVNEIENMISSYKNDKKSNHVHNLFHRNKKNEKVVPDPTLCKVEANSITASDIENYISSNTVSEDIKLDL